jgi:hypothetical protein
LRLRFTGSQTTLLFLGTPADIFTRIEISVEHVKVSPLPLGMEGFNKWAFSVKEKACYSFAQNLGKTNKN